MKTWAECLRAHAQPHGSLFTASRFIFNFPSSILFFQWFPTSKATIHCLLRSTPTHQQQLTIGWTFPIDLLLSRVPCSHFQNNPRRWDGEPCALGSYLSMVDPWYNTNISSLGSMVLKLAHMVGVASCRQQKLRQRATTRLNCALVLDCY